MQKLNRAGNTGPEPVELVETDEFDSYDTFEMYRVVCPDCAQPIALLADEDALPEHALCPSPGTRSCCRCVPVRVRRRRRRGLTDDTFDAQEQDTALLLTLPQGLDWRTQPFSHVGGPASRPVKIARAA